MDSPGFHLRYMAAPLLKYNYRASPFFSSTVSGVVTEVSVDGVSGAGGATLSVDGALVVALLIGLYF